MPDLLTANNLLPLIAGTIFDRADFFHHFERTGSTNVTAMHAGAEGAPEGSLFIAEEQLAGKGRGGHAWHSEPDSGIYISALLRPRMPAADTLWFSLIAGLAAHHAISQVIGLSCDLRWPNDIMLGEKKLGGILTELSSEGASVRYLVVGVGLNVNQASFPAELAGLATSLCMETDREWPRAELLAALLKSFHAEYAALRKDLQGAARSIIARFEQHSTYARGARVHVPEEGGYSGITQGLNASGFLQVRAESGLKTVLSGGVRKI